MTGRTTRNLLALVTATSLSLGLAACSGGTSSSATTSAAAPARKDNPSAGLTGVPIKVMTIGNWTQPQLGTANPEFPGWRPSRRRRSQRGRRHRRPAHRGHRLQ